MEKIRRIYIRHSDKEYLNGNSEIYKHDPGITKNGVERCSKVFGKLIDNWGIPSQIISSPYRRCRETALVLNSYLENPLEEIFIDVSLSEYLGNHKNVPIDVTEETKMHSPPHPESFDELIKRVNKHNKIAREKADNINSGVIWYITHGLIIKQLAYMIGIKLNKQFPTLTCFSILEEEDMIKSEQLLFTNERRYEKEKNWWDEEYSVNKILKRNDVIDYSISGF